MELPSPGTVVVALEAPGGIQRWCPYTGLVATLDKYGYGLRAGSARVDHPGGWSFWVTKWRVPSPAELAAYQLDQEAGL